MHQSKKGNDWHFGVKVQVDADMATCLVLTVVGTAGNVSDVTQAHALLDGGKKVVLGDASYQGIAKDEAIGWHPTMRSDLRKALKINGGHAKEKLEHTKASVRPEVEHCFHVIKCLFKHRKKLSQSGKEQRTIFYPVCLTNLVLPAGYLADSAPELRLECAKNGEKFVRISQFHVFGGKSPSES